MGANEKEHSINISGDGLKFEHKISESMGRKLIALIMGGSAIEETSNENHTQQASIGAKTDNKISPKEFMAKKKPHSGIERILCLAFYLTHHRSKQYFKTRELAELNTEAAQPSISNPAVFARNAVTAKYLTKAGGGKKQVTSLGENIVNALPDREKVKEALADQPRTKRHEKKSKKNLTN